MAASKAKRARKAPSKKAPAPAPRKQAASKASKKNAAAKPSAPQGKPKAKLAKAKSKGEARATAKARAKAKPAAARRPAREKAAPKPAAAPSPRKKATPARDARQALTQKRAIAAALTPAVDGKAVVDAYMRDVDHPFKAEMQAVREIILGVSPKIAERIKWNAPSFYYGEDLGAFNPRATEYAHLILLFPGGEGMQDSSGLLEGNHKDRREAKFYSLDDVKSKKRALEKIVKGWIELRD
jgi:hypothetical protein